MTAKYSQWATLSLLALLLSGMLFAPARARAARTAEAQPALSAGIADVHYALSADPTRLASLQFTLSAAPSNPLQVRLAANGSWYVCAAQGTLVTCRTPDNPALTSLERLELAEVK